MTHKVEGAKQSFRASRAYRYYREFQAAKERAALESLVDRIAQQPKVDVTSWVRGELAGRARHRRALPPSLSEARAVAVGARGWERYGLWQSLDRATASCPLFSDGCGDDVPFYSFSKEDQRARGNRLLSFIDATEGAGGPIHFVFFYADSSNLSRELMEGLAGRGIWTVLMGLDDRHTFLAHPRGDIMVGVETIAPYVDLYWTSWRTATLLHYSIGSRAWLGAAAADPAFFHPLPVERDIDVLFLGQAYGIRHEVIAYLRRRGIPIESRGHGFDGQVGYIPFEQTIELLSRARVVLGISNVSLMHDVTIPKGRDFEVPMCGACYVTQYVDELGDYFDIGRDIVCYGGQLNAAELVAGLLRDEARCARLRENALRRSRARNTWEARLAEMYTVLRG